MTRLFRRRSPRRDGSREPGRSRSPGRRGGRRSRRTRAARPRRSRRGRRAARRSGRGRRARTRPRSERLRWPGYRRRASGRVRARHRRMRSRGCAGVCSHAGSCDSVCGVDDRRARGIGECHCQSGRPAVSIGGSLHRARRHRSPCYPVRAGGATALPVEKRRPCPTHCRPPTA